MIRFLILFVYLSLFVFFGIQGFVNVLSERFDDSLYGFIGSIACLIALVFIIKIIGKHKIVDSFFKYCLHEKPVSNHVLLVYTCLVVFGFFVGVLAFKDFLLHRILFFSVGFFNSFLGVVCFLIFYKKVCTGVELCKKDYILAGIVCLTFAVIVFYRDFMPLKKNTLVLAYIVFLSAQFFFEGVAFGFGSLKTKSLLLLGLNCTMVIIFCSYILTESILYPFFAGFLYGLICLFIIKTIKVCEKCDNINYTRFNKVGICSRCHAKLC